VGKIDVDNNCVCLGKLKNKTTNGYLLNAYHINIPAANSGMEVDRASSPPWEAVAGAAAVADTPAAPLSAVSLVKLTSGRQQQQQLEVAAATEKHQVNAQPSNLCHNAAMQKN
jgi:hypothetical protein